MVRSLLVLLAALVLTSNAAAERPIRVTVLSSRADLVSGGDALVHIRAPKHARLAVTAGRRNVSRIFRAARTGVIRGLRVGRTLVTVRLPSGRGARIALVNHPIGGPLFAGPQVEPFACTTADHGLGDPVDAQCDAAKPVTHYEYMDASTGTLTAYDPGSPPTPDRVKSTTTDDGRTVPYVVRVERGTLDRSIYDIALLADPATGTPVWNGKLYVPFGGSCVTKHSQTAPGGIEVSQSAPDGGVLDDHQLSRGFAVATSGLQTLGQNCNPVVSAESLSMLEERLAESTGRPIRYAIGEGCSGGSIQQGQINAAYPGLLDGMIVECSFPDAWGPVQEVSDCVMLDRVFNTAAPLMWLDPGARQAVMGSQLGTTCPAWEVTFASLLRPDDRSSPITACDVPAGQQYDPATNRGGVRCSITDYQKAIWGLGPDGFARRPLDNVGVQYGLRALQDGRLSPAQFAELNADIGGLDIDGRPQAARTRAGTFAVRTAYRASQIDSGRNLARVPIIDLRGTGNNEVHTDHWSYATRARLDAANGTHANQIIWTDVVDGSTTLGRNPPGSQRGPAFDLMDRWLAAVHADHARGSLPAKVIRDKPADAVDACFATSDEITDAATCAQLFPHFGNARNVAGGPVANDVVRCSLTPLDRSDYGGVTFTDAEWAQLQAAFPGGVCDYAASARHRPTELVWPSFDRGPGGRALGPAPRSHRLS